MAAITGARYARRARKDKPTSNATKAELLAVIDAHVDYHGLTADNAFGGVGTWALDNGEIVARNVIAAIKRTPLRNA